MINPQIDRETAMVVLVDVHGRILMQHRTDDAPSAPGKWTPPGGALERGEEPQAAAHRELNEETGLIVDELSPYQVFERRSPFDGAFVRYHVFHGKTDATQADVVLGEGQAMVFLSPDEIADLDLSEIASLALAGFVRLDRPK